MLRMALPKCKELGIEKVLITCISGNEGSKKTILKNGGVIAKGKALTAVESGSVTVKDTKSGEETRLPADTVILAMGVRSNRPDVDALRAAYGDRLILVGDAARPVQIYDALHAAHDRAFVYEAR